MLIGLQMLTAETAVLSLIGFVWILAIRIAIFRIKYVSSFD